MLRLRPMPKRYRTKCRTALQFQLASSMPVSPGNPRTAAFNAACCPSPRAGGNPRTVRKSRPPARPHRSRRPIGQWCGDPVPRPPPWPRRSSLTPAATWRTTAPGAWATESDADAKPWHPSATVPGTAPFPSHPSPYSLSLQDRLTQSSTTLPHASAYFTLALV